MLFFLPCLLSTNGILEYSMSTTSSARSAHTLVVLSDTHCGSVYGLCAPDYVTAFGNKVSLNPQQAWLWSAWQRMQEDLHKRCPEGFDLIHAADVTEGIHHRSTETMSGEIGDHIGIAMDAHRSLVEAAGKVWVMEGTECHTGMLEHDIAKRWGAIPSPHGPAWRTLHINYCGVNIYGAHHISATKRAYLEASGLGIEFNDTVLRAAREKFPIPRVGIYGHRHVPSYFGSASGVAIVNGAWQDLTRYGRKFVPGAICTPSVTILDWSQEEEGDDPLVIQLRYTPKPTDYAKY